MEVFNVLTEPWMDVIDMEGNHKKVGLRDYIVNSHLYEKSAPQKEIKIIQRLQQRLAETFVIDAYQIGSIKDAAKILNKGSFDPDVVDEYIEDCVNNGVSFDLFDQDRPFMQTDKKTFENWKKSKEEKRRVKIDPVSSGKLVPKNATGNNKIFFNCLDVEKKEKYCTYDKTIQKIIEEDGNPEDVYELSFCDYMNYILFNQCVSGIGGPGYFSSLVCYKNVLPVFFQVEVNEKESLFKNILLNLGETDDDFDDKNIPIWKWDHYYYGNGFFEASSKIPGVGIHIPKLAGMFFPTRIIYPYSDSVDTNKRVVKKIYYAPVPFRMSHSFREEWLQHSEPSCACVYDKKLNAICRNENEPIWYQMSIYAGSYVKTNGEANIGLKALKWAIGIKNRSDLQGDLELSGFYVTIDNASYLSNGVIECLLPPKQILYQRCQQNEISKEEYEKKLKALNDTIEVIKKINKALDEKIKIIDKCLLSDIRSSGSKQTKKMYITLDCRKNINRRFILYANDILEKRVYPDLIDAPEDKMKDTENYLGVKGVPKFLVEHMKTLSKFSFYALKRISIPAGKSIEVRQRMIEAENKFIKREKGEVKMETKGSSTEKTSYKEKRESLDRAITEAFQKIRNAPKTDQYALKRARNADWDTMTGSQKVKIEEYCEKIFRAVITNNEGRQYFYPRNENEIKIYEIIANMAALYVCQNMDDCGKDMESLLARKYNQDEGAAKRKIGFLVDNTDKFDFYMALRRYIKIFERDNCINVKKLLGDIIFWDRSSVRERWINTIATN